VDGNGKSNKKSVEHVERKRKKIKIRTVFVCASDQNSVEKSNKLSFWSEKRIINKNGVSG